MSLHNSCPGPGQGARPHFRGNFNALIWGVRWWYSRSECWANPVMFSVSLWDGFPISNKSSSFAVSNERSMALNQTNQSWFSFSLWFAFVITSAPVPLLERKKYFSRRYGFKSAWRESSLDFPQSSSLISKFRLWILDLLITYHQQYIQYFDQFQEYLWQKAARGAFKLYQRVPSCNFTEKRNNNYIFTVVTDTS